MVGSTVIQSCGWVEAQQEPRATQARQETYHFVRSRAIYSSFHPGNYSQIPTLPLYSLIISTWWYCLCQEETGYLALTLFPNIPIHLLWNPPTLSFFRPFVNEALIPIHKGSLLMSFTIPPVFLGTIVPSTIFLSPHPPLLFRLPPLSQPFPQNWHKLRSLPL